MQAIFGFIKRFWRTSLAGAALLIFLIGIVVGDYLSDEMVLTNLRDWYETQQSKSQSFDAAAVQWQDLRTNLHYLEYLRVPLRWVLPDGGGIAEIDGSIVFATSLGEVGYFSATGSVVYLPQKIPMNLEAVDSHKIAKDPRFNRDFIRVTDILAVKKTDTLFDLYVGHNFFRGDCIEWRLSRITIASDGGALSIPDETWDTMFTAVPCVEYVKTGVHAYAGHQSGGRIVALGPDTLLMSMGDYELDGKDGDPKVSIDPALSLGKIIKFTISKRKAETYASGLRNPQGLLVDSKGRVWETEHGPQGGDELNLIEAGKNYGWPEVTLGVAYGYDNWPFNPAKGRHDAYTMPRHAWTPSVGVSNLIEANAKEFPSWGGDLLVGTLNKNTLYYLRLDGEHVVYAEPIALPGDRFRDVISLKDGRIAVLTDRPDLLILRNKELKTGGDMIVLAKPPEGGPAVAMLSGSDAFRAHCVSCHSLSNVNQVGPHLANLMGRRVGSVEGFGYSPALQRAGKTWSKDSLKTFLLDPQATYPGSTMPKPGASPQELDAVVDYLEAPN